MNSPKILHTGSPSTLLPAASVLPFSFNRLLAGVQFLLKPLHPKPKYVIFRLQGWAHPLYAPEKWAKPIADQFGHILESLSFADDVGDAVPFFED